MNLNDIGVIIAILVSIASVYFSSQQTRIMRKGLEQNIGADIASGLAPYLPQNNPSASTLPPADAASSPIVTALVEYVEGYVSRQLVAQQERVIDPRIEALTQRLGAVENTTAQRSQVLQQVEQAISGLTGRVGKAEASLRNTHVDIYNEILRNLSGVLADENVIRALAEETRTAHTEVIAAETRINAQVGRYANDIGNHDREIASLQAQLVEVRDTVTHEMVLRLMRAIAEQMLRSTEG